MANLPTRNNNPGDLRLAGQTGATAGDGGFASFSDSQSGYAALLNDVQAKINRMPDATIADFANVYAPSSDGNNSAQYAANLANKLGVAPNTPIKSLQARIGDVADAIAGNEGYQPGLGSFSSQTPPPPPANTPPAPTQDQTPPPDPNATPNPFSAQLPNVLTSGANSDLAKGAANFLFPIAGDLKDDFTGQNNKTVMQQVGDAGLSALPFIPGLGEVGEGARIGEAGIAAGKAGLLARAAASPIARGAAVGYGAGVASNLSQGQNPFTSWMPNQNTIAGAVLGGAAPAVTGALSSVASHASGISPQMENALAHAGITPEQYTQYVQAAQARARDIRAPAPFELAADQLDKASETIDSKVKEAGKMVGEAKSTLGNMQLPDMTPIINDFADRVEKDYGIRLSIDHTGQVQTEMLPDRTMKIAPGEVNRLGEAFKQLTALHGSTARNASDVISALDNSVNYAKAANGRSFDPVEGLLQRTRQQVDGVVRKVSPTLANANDRFAALKGLENEITKMAGGTNQRGELLIRRVFSGDKSGDVQGLFGKIKNETGIDLINHSVLARHAIESVGDSSQKSLLHQVLEGAQPGATTIPQMMINAAKFGAQKTFANPITRGANIVSGKQGPFSRWIPSLATKAAVEGSRLIPSLRPGQ